MMKGVLLILSYLIFIDKTIVSQKIVKINYIIFN